MKYTLLFITISLLAFSCKKDLVDTSKNTLVDITSQEQFNDFKAQKTTFVFFHASWCKICKEQRPAVEELSTDSELNGFNLGELEFDDHKDIAKGVNVTGFPTILIFKNGVEAHRLNGKGHSKDKLKELLLQK